MIPVPPVIILLNTMATTLEAIDFAATLGLDGVSVRHNRNRKPADAERPVVEIVWVGDDKQQGVEIFHNAWETTRQMDFKLRISRALPSAGSGQDPTGWAGLLMIGAVCMSALAAPDSPMRNWCDEIDTGAINPDENSDPDNGRLEREGSVVYRVRTDDENVILAQGVMA